MNPLERIVRLYNIHLLIDQECTGSPDDFSKRFSISRRLLYNEIEKLKDYGAIIKFSRCRQTFYYINAFQITNTVFWIKEIQEFIQKNLSVQGSCTEGE